MDVRERSAVMISSVVDHRAPVLMESPALVDCLISGSMQILLESCNAAAEAHAEHGRSDEAADDDEDDEFASSCRGLGVQVATGAVIRPHDVVVV